MIRLWFRRNARKSILTLGYGIGYAAGLALRNWEALPAFAIVGALYYYGVF